MTTLDELKALPRMSVRITSGWAMSVSCNTPARVVKVEIIYTTKNNERKVFGSATAKQKDKAVAMAWQAALDFMNAD